MKANVLALDLPPKLPFPAVLRVRRRGGHGASEILMDELEVVGGVDAAEDLGHGGREERDGQGDAGVVDRVLDLEPPKSRAHEQGSGE